MKLRKMTLTEKLHKCCNIINNLYKIIESYLRDSF